MGIIVFAPAVAYFIPMPWQLAGAFAPTYWPARTLLLSLAGHTAESVMFGLMGIVIHLLLLWCLYRRFLLRAD